ncbi:MAG: hypothetical protein ABI654_15470 [Betaproteobacteria bacterium]
MDLRHFFSSPSDKGFMDSPLFFGALGTAVSSFVLYTLATGSIRVDKAGTTIVTRAQQPGFFWFSVLLLGTMGAGLLLHAVRQYRRNAGE